MPRLLLAVFLFLIYYHLGNYSFWQDEAETALLAKSILDTGLPYAFHNGIWITQFHGQESITNHLWFFTPWLPFYLTALSFKIFGFSEWAGRFPFVLSGLLAAFFLWHLVRHWTRSRSAVFFTLLFYITNASLILYTRQCKYYSLYLLGFLMAFYGITVRKRPLWTLIGFLIAFHCNYFSAGLAFLGFSTYVFFTKEGRELLSLWGKTVIGLLIFFGPFLLLGSMGERTSIVSALPTLPLFFKKLGTHIYYWNNQVFPFLLLFLLFWKRPNQWKLICFTMVVPMIILPLLSSDVFRYDLHLLPLFTFLLGFWMSQLFETRRKLLGTAFFGLLFFTGFFQNMPDAIHQNNFSLLFQKQEWTALKNYYFGNYPDPMRILPEKLNTHRSEGEHVYLNHDQLPWAWYSKMPLAYQGEKNKTPPKEPPLPSFATDPAAVDWWIGPHWAKLGNGPFWDQKNLKADRIIDTGIPVADWDLNSPIRYQHFLKRFAPSFANDETILLIHLKKK